MIIRYTILALLACFTLGCSSSGKEDVKPEPEEVEVPEKLEIGYSLGVRNFTNEILAYAKSVGIDHVEAAGMNYFFDSNGELSQTEGTMQSIFNSAKAAADAEGINVSSIHMAYSEKMDLSLINEESRKKVVQGHIKLLEYIKVLKPDYILVHPSYYLDPPNQREQRKSQLLKSLNELNEAVKAIGSTLVVENMLGPELMAGQRERPLMRTVEECVEIMGRLPRTIGLAVDMCHIKNPEILIERLGDRLMTVHVSDGTGRAENHWFPCSGQGENDWNAILSALDKVGYEGVFMYECNFDDVKDLVNCYNTLHANYVQSLK